MKGLLKGHHVLRTFYCWVQYMESVSVTVSDDEELSVGWEISAVDCLAFHFIHALKEIPFPYTQLHLPPPLPCD